MVHAGRRREERLWARPCQAREGSGGSSWPTLGQKKAAARHSLAELGAGDWNSDFGGGKERVLWTGCLRALLLDHVGHDVGPCR